jgi:hypothetical protein
MAKKYIYEHYDNIYNFMDTIKTRSNNGFFGTDSHDKGDEKWSGARDYPHAVEMLSNGLPEKTNALKKDLQRFKAQSNVNAVKRVPRNYYHGYAPNVPAAIIGLPKSMRQIQRTPQKVKAVSIIYDGTQNCGTTGETLDKAGSTVLQLVYWLELQGYRVALEQMVFTGRCNGTYTTCTINLKEWQQPLDIMKLSFPLTSPAMFRRFGFHWAEGIEGFTSHVYGYGSHLEKSESIETIKSTGRNIANAFVIDVNDVKRSDFDAIKLAKRIGIVKDEAKTGEKSRSDDDYLPF